MEPSEFVVARIDAYGRLELQIDGKVRNLSFSSLEEARSGAGQAAIDYAARLGRTVGLEASDPDGSWLFHARPDGSMVEHLEASSTASTRARNEALILELLESTGVDEKEAGYGVDFPLGSIGSIECSIALTSQPWTLELDCIVVSVGETLGSLGAALSAHIPDPAWREIDFKDIFPSRPRVLHLTDGAKASTLKRVILANPTSQASSRVTEAGAMLASNAAIQLAVREHSRAIGLPLLATGRLGRPSSRIAQAVIPGVLSELSERASQDNLARLVFVCEDSGTAADIATAWHEHVRTYESERIAAGESYAAYARMLPMRPAARELQTLATQITEQRDRTTASGTDFLLGALLRVSKTKLSSIELRNGASWELVDSIPELDSRLAHAFDSIGVLDPTALKQRGAHVVETGQIVRAASTLAASVGASAIYSHHLLAVALEAGIDSGALEALGVTQNALRAALRRGITRRWPDETEAIWDDYLADRIGIHKRQGIGSDLWTTEDQLGYSVYADAIARGIQHGDTRAPLTIGIKAPWGAGKTSLMRMIKDRLEWPDSDADARTTRAVRSIHLSSASRAVLRAETVKPKRRVERVALTPVSNKILLSAVSASISAESASATEQDISASLIAEPGAMTQGADDEKKMALDAETSDLWRPTVWFNPWMYQSGEQVWAGLAHEIISQVTDRMSVKEREYFWLHLNRSRIDEHAVRRRIYGVVLGRLLPFFVSCGVLLGLGLLAVLLAGWDWIGGILVAAAPVLFAGASLVQSQKVLRAPAVRTFERLVSAGTSAGESAGATVSDGVKTFVDAADYRSRTGSFYLMHSDIAKVLTLVATEDRPVVIFVDDLDRCTPSTVVQVIEAINLFLAGQLPNCIFVLAMDPTVVASHIEIAYGGLAEKLAQRSGSSTASEDLGWRFLEKIVQLPLTLPLMQEAQRKSFYSNLFHSDDLVDEASAELSSLTDVPLDPVRPSVELSFETGIPNEGRPVEIPTSGAREGQREVSSSTAESTRRRSDPAVAASRKIVDEALGGNSPAVQAAISVASRHLAANPREIKRFVNVFRFLVMIDDERRRGGQEANASLNQLAKIAVLNLRWPALVGRLAEGGPQVTSTVLSLLEDAAARGERITRKQGAPAMAADSSSEVLLELEQLGLNAHLLAELQEPEFQRFLLSSPRIGAASSGLL